jgi:hypothetical protein
VTSRHQPGFDPEATVQLDPEATVRLALPSMAAPVPDAPLPDPALPATAGTRDGGGRDPGSSVKAVARGGGANLIGAAVTTVANLLLSVVVTRSMSQANAGIFFSITSLVLLLATVGRVGTGGGAIYFLPRLRLLGSPAEVSECLRWSIRPTVLVSCLLGLGLLLFAPQIADLAVGRDPSPDADPGAAAVRAGAAVRGARRRAPVDHPRVRPDAYHGDGGADRPAARPAHARRAGRADAQRAAARAGLDRALPAGDDPVRAAGPAARAGEPAPPLGRRAVRLHPVRILAVHRPAGADLADPGRPAAGRRAAGGRDPRPGAGRAVRGGDPVPGRRAAVNQAISVALQPRLSAALARRDLDEAGMLYRTTTGWLVLTTWPLYLLVGAFPAALLGIFGHKYASATDVVVVLCAAMLIATASGQVDTVLMMAGKSTWNLAKAVLALVVQLGLDLLLLPHLGILGAAIGWAVSILVANLVPLGSADDLDRPASGRAGPARSRWRSARWRWCRWPRWPGSSAATTWSRR